MRRKLSAFVIMVLLMMHLFALSAYAETAQQDGLVVTLQTNRDVYDSNEQIQVSIEIKNTNETAVQNVKVMPYASEPYMLANANQSTINIGTMKDQSIEKVDIVFIRGEDIAITLPMTGDSSHPLFWGSCLVISLGIVCVLLKQKKGLRFLSLFLCLCICSSVISVHHAEASDAEAQMIVVEKTIDVAGESVTVGVGVSYNHVGNASQTGTLTASQTTILANSSASPVYFYVQADGGFTSVSLIDALTGLNVATMLDDGQYSISGDDLPNDDIYSCVVHVPSASVGTQRYYARMTDASNHTVLTNEVEISVVGKFTGTDLEAMDQVHDSLGMLVSSLEYQRMSIGERAEAIAEQLQVHAENGLIDGSSIKYDTRNQIYTFTHANGVLGGVMLAPFHSDLNGSAPMTRAERETAALAKQQQKQMRSFALMRMMPANAYEDMEIGDAMIFYAFDEAVNSSRYPHYLSMANDWSARGLNTSIDQAVTAEELKSIDDYKVAVLSMHGVCYQSRDKSGAVLCLQEEATESKNKLYTSDLKKRNLATVTLDNGKTCYWVFASFFEDHYGANDLQNTFIFSEACSFWGENSTSDKSMALAFEKAGATAVVGFYNPVYTEYSRDMLQHYVDSLLDGKTAYEALMAGQKKYGSDDSKYTGSTSNSLFSFVKGAAYALFGGSTDSQLIASDLKNTSFEQASSASGWNTTGDVRVLTKLASLKPTNGSRMAILTTGIGSAESSYLEGTEGSILSQSFIVPSEAGAVQFQYDVVSEEPMEYVDSIFDDKFVVRILGSNGQVYKEKTIESVNESTWYSISGIDFEGGDDTTYHTQWKTGVIDISEYRNQAITLQFVVYDMGDSIYDTAALIDDVKLLSGSGFEIDECSLHLSTSSWTPILTGESKTVSVTKHDGSSFSVKVTQLDPNGNALDSANEWLTVSKSGSSIKLTATANYAAQPRTATVTVTCACGGTKKLIVTQMSGAPKPTLQLRIGDSYYGENDTYGTLTAGDTLYLTAEFTNAKRLYIRVYNSQTGESVVDKTFDSEVAGSSANYYPVFNKNLESGIYVLEATVSNSDIRNAVWAQKVTVKLNIELTSDSDTFSPLWPCATADRITTLYYYSDGDKHSCHFKYGIDIAGGGNILATESGQVIVAKYSPASESGFGNYVVIAHDNGMESWYCHLDSYSVSVGDQVTRGQVIGVMGETSAKYFNMGVHLHFELSDKKSKKTDPWKEYFREEYKDYIVYSDSVYNNEEKYGNPEVSQWINEHCDRTYIQSVGLYRWLPKVITDDGINRDVLHSDIGAISRKYEATAGCGHISSGNGDAGGKSYGSYQLASNTGAPLTFVNWLIDSSNNSIWVSMATELRNAYNTDGGYGSTFDATWKRLANENEEEFNNAQTEYAYNRYYLNYLNKINSYSKYSVTGLAEYGTPENIYPLAIHQMIWARAVQGCPSPQWIAEAWSIADAKDGAKDGIVDPALWIYQVYWEASKTDRADPRDRDSDTTAYIIQAKDCIVGGRDYTQELADTYLVYFHTSTSPWQVGVYRRLNPIDGKEYLDIIEQYRTDISQ